MEGTHALQRLEAMENGVPKFLALHVLPNAGFEFTLSRLCSSMSPALRLRYLPIPERSRTVLVLYEDESALKPERRQPVVTIVAVVFFMMCSFMNIFFRRNYPSSNDITSEQGTIIRDDETRVSHLSMRLLLNLGKTAASSITDASIPWAMHLFTTISSTSTIALWTLESYRQAFFPTPLWR